MPLKVVGPSAHAATLGQAGIVLRRLGRGEIDLGVVGNVLVVPRDVEQEAEALGVAETLDRLHSLAAITAGIIRQDADAKLARTLRMKPGCIAIIASQLQQAADAEGPAALGEG